MTDGLRIESRGAVRVVTLDRPSSLNAIDRDMHRALARIWADLDDDPDSRAVVVTGAGTAFSGGGDLTLLDLVGRDPVARADVMAEARRIIVDMLDFRLPVVAAVNGPAVGLGCSVALLCDVVLMAPDAYLADPHVAIGLVAGDGGAALWPILTSPLKAKELLFTGARVAADEAERIGLATRVVKDGDLLEEAMRTARHLADLPAHAVQATKRAVNLHLKRSLEGIVDYAVAAETSTITDPDHRRLVATMQRRNVDGERLGNRP